MADYPFTTLEPVLGTLEGDDRQLVIADIPGLIEGASAGAGLGHEFLAHVERCRLLVHVLDLKPLDGSDPEVNFETVEAELREHGHGLAELPRLLALSKADLVPPEEAAEAVESWRERLGVEVLTSAATGEGLEELGTPSSGVPEDEHRGARRDACYPRYRPGRGGAYSVERTGPRYEGERIERLIARHDIDNDEALRYVEERLRSLGVIKALESAGFEPGDDVEIAGIVFELDPGCPPVARYVALICMLALLAGCGGDDNKDAEQTVRDFVTALRERDADTFCEDLVTDEFLGQFSGATGDKARESCKRAQGADRPGEGQAREGPSTKVDGEEAAVTAVIERQGQRLTQVYRLKKEDGACCRARARCRRSSSSWDRASSRVTRASRASTCSPSYATRSPRHRAGDAW